MMVFRGPAVIFEAEGRSADMVSADWWDQSSVKKPRADSPHVSDIYTMSCHNRRMNAVGLPCGGHSECSLRERV